MDATAMMGVVPHQELTTLDQQREQRASSCPLATTRSRTSDKMGRSYRTPSPLRGAQFDLEYDITPPKADASVNGMTIVGTPPTSPALQAADPVTPGYKQPPMGLFGLLTPSTPGFGDISTRTLAIAQQWGDHSGSERDFSPESGRDKSPVQEEQRHLSRNAAVDSVDSGDEEPLQTQYQILQEQIKEAQSAATLAIGDQATSRRSTRLAQKESVKILPKETSSIVSKKSTKVLDQASPPQNVAPSQSSFTAEAVVPLPSDACPAPLTLDWSLQYPPGGSTHPSYAYPMMDPRLFFDPKVVPIVDGLPSVFKVPTLTLPMGWKHVSWSGFLPIAFDPNHQGFKLTPIGPLPLTCEEVQQGGLAKYVPGGAEHPEAGLLPDITLFSDGSDEVYNFEDIDWTLPWPKEEMFERTHLHDRALSPSAFITSAQVVIAPPPPPFYDESRDCPDNVVDIRDAWRWLEEKELHPDAPFVPTPDKSWKNTGIYRTSTKTKSPIASLMGLVIADTIESPNNFLATYMVNQNGRTFCPYRSVATPVYANIKLLKDVELTLVELLSYFPGHYAWRKGADRLVRAGFTGSDIANFINWSRGLEGDAVKNSGSVKDSLAWEYDPISRKRFRIERDTETAIVYSAEDWQYEVWDLIEYPLLGLTHGLKHMPEGPNAGPLTALIKHCREQNAYQTLLSDVPSMLTEQGLSTLIESFEGGDPDKEVIQRYQDVLKADRKRVLISLKETGQQKRATEKNNGKRAKRVKTG
ncbi:hypothetical protein DE146DRAFT_197651 [Phaeosphaeria sp. MPI-PUGE-AT-0046c]|nr:hypothetical protein DE146DRAFT_197651 [Phaeosphaeria sp. MPI-PUGE-AT-0046c]